MGHADRRAVVLGETRDSGFEDRTSPLLYVDGEGSLRCCDRYEMVCHLDVTSSLLHASA
jgi:hypothetical protein